MVRTLPYLTALLIATVVAGGPAFAQDSKSSAKGNNIATVNGVGIPKARADVMMAEQMSQGAPNNDEMRKLVREELVRREVLAQEARKKGLDKKPDVLAQMDVARQGLLIRAYLQDYVKSHPVTDEQVKKEYEAIKAQMGSKEYKVRHILVDSEDKAKAIIARLQKGEKFEDLAKESADPGSKDRGGDLGWASPASYVKPFSDALTKMEKGKFSATPVKTDFGYHVIQLEDVRDMKHPPLEEVKAQIQQRLQQQLVEKHVAELRAKAKVD